MRGQGLLWALLLLLAFAGCRDAANNEALLADYGKKIVETDVMPFDTCRPGKKKLVQDSCKEGFICVPGKDRYCGRCYQECGDRVQGLLVKKPKTCESGKECVLLRRDDLSAVGMFCVTPQRYLDGPCSAPFDDQACMQGLSCLPMIRRTKHGKTLFSQFRCKQECSANTPCKALDEVCTFGEMARNVKQHGPNGLAHVACSVSQCKNGQIGCPCHKDLGHTCEVLIVGLDVGTCVHRLGICQKSEQKPVKSIDL